MPQQKRMNRTGGGRQAKKEKGEESGDGTREGSKLVYRPRLKRGRGYNATRWTHDAFCVSLLRPPPVPFVVIRGRSFKFTGKTGPLVPAPRTISC